MSRYVSSEEKQLIESIPQDEMRGILARVKAKQKELEDRKLAELRARRRVKACPCPHCPRLTEASSQ